MTRWIAVLGVLWAAGGCSDESCFPTGAFEIDITGTLVIDANSEMPACRPMGEFLALPEPLHTTIDADGSWTFDDTSLSILLYPEDCLFTLIQRFEGTDAALGAYTDQLSYIALAQPAPDVWTGSGVLRRDYAGGDECENRISGVSVTLTAE